MVEVNNLAEIPYSTFIVLKSFLHVYIIACRCQSTDIYRWFSWNSTAVVHLSHSSHARTLNAVRKPLPPHCKCAFCLSGWKVRSITNGRQRLLASPAVQCTNGCRCWQASCSTYQSARWQLWHALHCSQQSRLRCRAPVRHSFPESTGVCGCSFKGPESFECGFHLFQVFFFFLVMPKVMLSDFVQRLISAAALMTPTAKRNVDKKPLKHI